MKDYQCIIMINASAKQLYTALTTKQGLQNWWTNDCTVDAKQGGKATFRFNNTYAVMQLEKLTPYKEVHWKCIDQNHEATPPLEKKGEWADTHIIFQIIEKTPQQVELHFTHSGLNHALECYEICENSWNHYLKTSLRNYLEKEKGENYQIRKNSGVINA